MLIPNDDGAYIGGVLDVLCILHNVVTDTYHAAFFEESALPGGQDISDLNVVRLRSKMHHTEGTTDLESAKKQLKDLANRIKLDSTNITEKPVEWSGELGITLLARNWKKVKGTQVEL